MMKSCSSIVMTLGLLVGSGVGCTEPPEATGTTASSITNGTVDAGHPSVGTVSSAAGSCTGTLVGRRTVLTAAHCVGGGMAFFVGNRSYGARAVVHPEYTVAPSNDLAILALTEPVGDVEPSPVSASRLGLGAELLLVGFGQTGERSRDFGTKRAAGASLTWVFPTTFSFNGSHNTCYGDSGGPTFAADGQGERVVGVHSTKTGDCGRFGTDVRVDAYIPWIVEASGGDVRVVGAGALLGTDAECLYDYHCAGRGLCLGYPGRCDSP